MKLESADRRVDYLPMGRGKCGIQALFKIVIDGLVIADFPLRVDLGINGLGAVCDGTAEEENARRTGRLFQGDIRVAAEALRIVVNTQAIEVGRSAKGRP